MRVAGRIVLGVLVAVLALAGCSDDGNDEGDVAAQDTTTTQAPTSTTAAGSQSTLNVSDHPEFGEILVGPTGRTLYLFERDQGTTTGCTGACATNWPALVASEPTVGEGVDEAKV